MEKDPVYPIKPVEQNAVFYGIDGFTLLGTHGTDSYSFHDHFLSIGRQDLHAQGVKQAVAFAREHLVDGASEAIVSYLANNGLQAAICDKDFPRYVTQEDPFAGKKGAKARNCEEYGWITKKFNYWDTLSSHYQAIPAQDKKRVLEAHGAAIAHDLAMRVFPGADAQASAELEKALLTYLKGLRPHRAALQGNPDLLPAVETQVKRLLLKQLDVIAHDPEAFADAARAFIERPVALREHVKYADMPDKRAITGGEPAPALGKRKLFKPWQRHDAAPASVTPVKGYERPFIDPAKPGPAMAPILERINDVLMQDFTPQMRALVLDLGLQVMVMGEKQNAKGESCAMYALDTQACHEGRYVHLKHVSFGEGKARHTEDKQVIQEELVHYITFHPAIALKDEALLRKWEKAFAHDIGGLVETHRVSDTQLQARKLIRAHYHNRSSYSWDRHKMHNFEPILLEISAELFALEKAGVGKAEMRKAFPELYPLQEALMEAFQREGQKVMDAKPLIARWAQEPIVPHLQSHGHVAHTGARETGLAAERK